MRAQPGVVGAAITVVALLQQGGSAAAASYRVDPAQSRVTIAVGKTGAFSAFGGHTHRVEGPIESGTVEFDPDRPESARVRLVIGAAALKVSAQGEPPADVPKVQEAMDGDKVLDVAHHAQLLFESSGVTLDRHQGSAFELTIDGRMTIRGVSRPIRVPVHADRRQGEGRPRHPVFHRCAEVIDLSSFGAAPPSNDAWSGMTSVSPSAGS
ncbi:MAG TPA: YceI family protein [Vicinamibacterales bacterium]|nr:YceI family protein [Vicinamibacterales bacterium]